MLWCAKVENNYTFVYQVLGLGMDGARVMASDINGVTGLMHTDNPFTVCVHCVCHRLSLAVSQASRDIPEMKMTGTIIGTVYNYVMQSPNKLAEFKTLVIINDNIRTLNFLHLFMFVLHVVFRSYMNILSSFCA